MSAHLSHIIVGATGFIGRTLLERWPHRDRQRVGVLLRRPAPAWLHALGFAIVDGGLDALRARADLSGPDSVIVNLARPDGGGDFALLTRALVGLAGEARCGRYVHASSIEVNAGCRQRCIDESTAPAPVTAYQREHVEAESAAHRAVPAGRLAILRLGAVFGSGGANVKVLAEEAMRSPIWWLALRRLLYGRRRMYLVPVETAAAAIGFLADPATALPAMPMLLTEDHLPENNFAAVQDIMLAAYRRAGLAALPGLPPIALTLVLRLRGVHPADPMRRFDGRVLDEMGFVRPVELHERLSAYAAVLREQAAP